MACLGTGTGVVPRGMAKYGAELFHRIISENQIAEAKELSKGMDNTNTLYHLQRY